MGYTPYTPEAHCPAEDNKDPPHSGPSSSCPNFRLDTSHSVLPMLCNKEQIALVDSEFPISGGVQAKQNRLSVLFLEDG